MAEFFDVVLAEMRQAHSATMREYANRLQAAHEREVGELRHECTQRIGEVQRQQAERLAAHCRADAAVALLREVSRNGWGKSELSDLHETPLLERIDAFLAHGGQEKGNG